MATSSSASTSKEPVVAELEPVVAGPTQPKEEEEEEEKKEEEPKLPKLTPAEFRVYNHMAEHMEYFVGHPPSHLLGGRGLVIKEEGPWRRFVCVLS